MIKLGRSNGNIVSFDTAQSPNNHILIVGKSGMGKTVCTQKLMLEIIQSGGTIIAFDLHHTFADSQIHSSLKDNFFENLHDIDAYGSGISCPFFSPLDYEYGCQENASGIIQRITNIMAPIFNLQVQQKNCFRDAVQYIYDKNLYPEHGITSLEEALITTGNQTASIVKEKLHQIVAYNVFQDGPLFVETGKINILRLSKFDLSTQALIVEIVLSYLWILASSNSLPCPDIYLALDEFQNLSLKRNNALSQILSEGRKFGINLLLATQALSMTFSAAEQKRLMQSGLQLFFRPAANESRLLARMIDCSRINEWNTILNSLKIGEFIGQGSLLMGNYLIEQPIKISAR